MQSLRFTTVPVLLTTSPASIVGPGTNAAQTVAAVGYTPATPICYVKGAKLVNTSASGVLVTIYRDAANTGTAGLEVWQGTVPANSTLEPYFLDNGCKLESTKFLTAKAATASVISMSCQCEANLQ